MRSRRVFALVLVAMLAVSCGGTTPAATSSPAPATSAAAAAPTATPTPTWAPTRDVELVVQAAAGGGSDIFARKIADLLTKEKVVGQPINVVNKAGGSGAVAYSYVKQKTADPHTLATVTLSYLTTPMQQNAGFTYKDFTNILTLAVDDFIAVVKAESSYKTLTDLVNAAKAKPKEIKVGGEVNAALLGGTIDFAIANPGESLSLIEGKKLRAVASFSPSRLPGFDAPTAKEQGINVQWEQFRGIIAPGGLTAAQRTFWEKALMQITKNPEWDKYMKDNTLRALVQTGTDTDKYLDAQNTSLKTVLTSLGVIK